jgi:hypothetical protein
MDIFYFPVVVFEFGPAPASGRVDLWQHMDTSLSALFYKFDYVTWSTMAKAQRVQSSQRIYFF